MKKIILIILIILIAVAVVFFLTKKEETVIETSDVVVFSPQLNEVITSPLVIEGKARGFWFFEADFPIVLVNWDGLIIAEAIAKAQTDWMTEDFVEFKAVIDFKKPDYGKNGTLIFQKDNPSGLPENDAAFEVPILFE